MSGYLDRVSRRTVVAGLGVTGLSLIAGSASANSVEVSPAPVPGTQTSVQVTPTAGPSRTDQLGAIGKQIFPALPLESDRIPLYVHLDDDGYQDLCLDEINPETGDFTSSQLTSIAYNTAVLNIDKIQDKESVDHWQKAFEYFRNNGQTNYAWVNFNDDQVVEKARLAVKLGLDGVIIANTKCYDIDTYQQAFAAAKAAVEEEAKNVEHNVKVFAEGKLAAASQELRDMADGIMSVALTADGKGISTDDITFWRGTKLDSREVLAYQHFDNPYQNAASGKFFGTAVSLGAKPSIVDVNNVTDMTSNQKYNLEEYNKQQVILQNINLMPGNSVTPTPGG